MDGNEDKLAAKVDFLAGCAAVHVLAIGASAIKQLTAKGIAPIRVDEMDRIDDLLRGISTAIESGGVPWVDRAIAAQAKAASGSSERFAAMEKEGWEG